MKLSTMSLILAASAVAYTGCVNPNGSPDNTGSGAVGRSPRGDHGGGHRRQPAWRDRRFAGGGGRGGGGRVDRAFGGSGTAGAVQAQAPQTYVRVSQQQPLSTADVKALAKAGIAEDVIINQLASTHSGFRLSSADIIDLRDSGVSDKVVNYMINTASDPTAVVSGMPAPVVVNDTPPPPQVETVTIAPPGPDYIWIRGNGFGTGGGSGWAGTGRIRRIPMEPGWPAIG